MGNLRKAKLRFDVTKRLRAVLVRRDLLTHIKNSFPRMEEYTKNFGTWAWYEETFKLAEDGTRTDRKGKMFRPQDCTALDEDIEDSTVLDSCSAMPQEMCSTYLCYRQLVAFCTQLMQNSHEVTLCKLVQNYVPGKALNLAVDDANPVREALQVVKEKYEVDFPTKPAPAHVVSHKMMHSVADGASLEVTTMQKVENIEEYKVELAKYNDRATNNEEQAIKEYLDARLVLLVDNLMDGETRIAQTLMRYPLMKEKKRKLFVYDVTLDGPVNWTAIKKRRLSVWAGAGPGLCQNRLKAGGVGLVKFSSPSHQWQFPKLLAVAGFPAGGLQQQLLQ